MIVWNKCEDGLPPIIEDVYCKLVNGEVIVHMVDDDWDELGITHWSYM